jgi:ATP-binding cassette subfamily B protein
LRRPTTFDPGQVDVDNQLRTLREMLPYLWPAGEPGLRRRVVIAMALLIAAKATTVYVPIILRDAVDALSLPSGQIVLTLALGLLIAYGAARILARGFGELRDAVFAKVAQHAIRLVALRTFRHLHALSLRFHLERQTGGLSRVIERGTKGIEFLLSFVLFNVLPTLLEILLVAVILWALFDWRFSAITLVTIVAYVWFTFAATERRIRYRREMNQADTEANTKAVDSLLNYETVKYFGNEDHEARRFDLALADYQQAAVRTRTSLSLLNSGQVAIVSLGMTAMMALAAVGVARGTMTVGDFVMVNAYLMQLSMPLGLLGTVYREIKQSLVDDQAVPGRHGGHVHPAARGGRGDRYARRAGALGGRRRDRLRERGLRLRPAAADPARRRFYRAGRRERCHRGPERRRQVDHQPHPVPLLRRGGGPGRRRRPGHPLRATGEPARGHRHRSPGHGAVQ